ncbi:MAG: BamA/TamA family outer membrane protein [Cytophagaceae bacterium]|nr:BamA/TamA family outer membrane protein [Cytophagaceae bacterium]
MKRNRVLLLLILVLLNACNVARRLPPDERLYVGADVKVQADPSVSKNDQKAVKSQLTALARPRPSKTLFGFPYKVWLYYLLNEQKKENKPQARRFGAPPVFASARALTSNETVFKSFLENEGYFRSGVQSRFVEKKGYQARAEYTVQVSPRYEFDTVRYLADTSSIGKVLYRSSQSGLIKAGNPYRFEVIEAERERIAQLMKREGYFYFQPDYIAILADSAIGQNRVRPYVALKPDMPAAARLPYKMRNVYIYSNYSLDGSPRTDTSRRRAMPVPADTAMRRFFIVDTARLFNPRLFRDVVSLRPGRRYNSRAQDLTLSRFINLGTFKFVRNRFQPVGDTTVRQLDSAALDVHYYLTPYPKKSVRLEAAGTSKSNSLVGSQLTLSWRNRNLLRRAELLTINGTAGIEWQVGARSQGVTNFRYSLDGILSFPRLVAPFRIRYDRRQILPKTNLTLGYQLIRRAEFYDLNSFQTTFGYAFRTSQKVEHDVTPFSVAYVKPANYGTRFTELITAPDVNLNQQYFDILRSEQLIFSSLYSYNYNSSPQNNSHSTLRLAFNLEPAGNLAGLLVKPDAGERRIFGVAFSQYVRSDVDARHYWKLTPGLTWANRLFAGLGIPYGNAPNLGEPQLPFIKQYFSGGSNSIRAFRPRTVGPGTHSRGDQRSGVLLQDGGGDVKLEGNTELRALINRYLQGALFLDAGNVWMYANETTYGPGSKFSSSWWRELAVGTGVGLRIDVQYFVLRFDLATPLRRPGLPEGERWVTNQINFRDRDWRRDNLVLNIAVGYPF